MGFFDKFKKKDKKNNETTKKVTDPGIELTEDEIDDVIAKTRPDDLWCPKVDVTPTVTIPYSKNDPHQPIDRNR